jgi:hypothetical protein
MSRRTLPKIGESASRADPKRPLGPEFCNESGCMDFAISADPTVADVRKFKCPAHFAAAVARGDSGKRDPIPSGNDYMRAVDEGARDLRNASIALQLAAGNIPRDDGAPQKSKLFRKIPARKAKPTKPVFQVTLEGKLVEAHASAEAAGHAVGCSRGSVFAAVNKKEPLQGYFWFYHWPSPIPAIRVRLNRRGGRPVEEIDSAGVAFRWWPTVTECERQNGIGSSILNYCLLHRGGAFKNRRFRFAAVHSPSPALLPAAADSPF